MLWLLLLVLPRPLTAFWWSSVAQISMHSSSAGTLLPSPDCSTLDGLSPGQTRMCRLFYDHMPFVGLGARDAILECQHQFKYRRWNCSTYGNGIMGPIHNKGTKEAAFTYAVVSAGVAHQVARGCKLGLLETCGCGRVSAIPNRSRRVPRSRNSVPPSPPTSGKVPSSQQMWQKQGCSDNIEHGFRFAQDFIDIREKELVHDKESEDFARAIMNRWNNKVGRKLIKRRVQRKCKCHGVSGSCDITTCWEHLAPLRIISSALLRKYDDAIMVTVTDRGNLRMTMKEAVKSPYRKSRRKRKERKRRNHRNDLVYIENSPDYCMIDPNSGIFGTAGRECNKEGDGLDSCNDVCCGRGYNTHVKVVNERCNCDFKWCCKVECDVCRKESLVHTCKG